MFFETLIFVIKVLILHSDVYCVFRVAQKFTEFKILKCLFVTWKNIYHRKIMKIYKITHELKM